MPTGATIEALIRRFDRRLSDIERVAIDDLSMALVRSATRLEQELRRIVGQAQREGESESTAWREARARSLLLQVRGMLEITRGAEVEATIRQLEESSLRAGMDNAMEVLSLYGRQTVGASAVVRDDVAIRAVNAYGRLLQHGEEFARQAQQTVIDGVVRGVGWGETARVLREETGYTLAKAEQIVRTESVAASHAARVATYAEAGVSLGQWFATMDSRVCGYCAARAGNIYKLTEMHIPAHPNCRCFAAPYEQIWDDLGLVDHEWLKEHHDESVRRSDDVQRTGPSPFERAAGMERRPRAVVIAGRGAGREDRDIMPEVPIGMPSAVGGETLVRGPGPTGPGGGGAPPVAGREPWVPLGDLSILEVAAQGLRDAVEDFGLENIVDAVEDYTGHSYAEINGALRAGVEVPEEHRATLEGLNELFELDHARLQGDMQLWRGYILGRGAMPADLRSMVGTVYRDAGFMSTSYEAQGPLVTIDGHLANLSEGERSEFLPVLLDIRGREGDRAALVEAMSANPQDKEVLYDRNQPMRVLDVQMVPLAELFRQNGIPFDPAVAGVMVAVITLESIPAAEQVADAPVAGTPEPEPEPAPEPVPPPPADPVPVPAPVAERRVREGAAPPGSGGMRRHVRVSEDLPDGLKEEVAQAVDLVDRAVGSYAAPVSVVPLVDRGDRASGRYIPPPLPDSRSTIEISPESRAPLTGIIHEMGHYFDRMALGVTPGRGFATQLSSTPGAWALFEAVRKTPEYKALAEIQQTGYLSRDGVPVADFGEHGKRYAEYLLDYREIFARLFVQYVAAETGDEELKAQMRREAGVEWPYYFEDFESLRPLMRRVLDGMIYEEDEQ